ncbi:MAG TPA: regulatory protein RecX [Burkholderiales bacterium]
MGWLARREHSRAEVVAKLRRKGCDARIAADVVAALAAENYLSDERLAEVVARSRRRRGYGPMRIRKELERKGLADEAIERWSDARSKEWLAELERVRRRKFGARPPSSFAERAKQARFLQQRGFTYDQIQQALSSPVAD